jgi:hypothetical protein
MDPVVARQLGSDLPAAPAHRSRAAAVDDLLRREAGLATYGTDPEYGRLVAEEGAAFFRAVTEEDPATSRRLLSEGLSIAERRRARFFTGAKALHAELEDIFLGMEGVGECVRFPIKRRQAPS